MADAPAIAIVTHALLAGGVPDDRLLLTALADLGARPFLAAWDDPDVDWAMFDIAVVRSAWNYHQEHGAWGAWVARAAAATRLVNSPALLGWSCDKRYLGVLAAADVPIVPTVFLPPDEAADIAGLAAARGWDDMIIKPAVGASAAGVRRFQRDEPAGQVHFTALQAAGIVLLQPFMTSLGAEPERSLVLFGGALSHAFTKPAFNSNADGASTLSPWQPQTDEISVAQAAIAALGEVPTYARVDLVTGESGPVVMEVELIEPDLGLRLMPGAARRLAAILVNLAPYSAATARCVGPA
jgi:glutathione synthase/RimK-type ligase-like ATP-grasp enzyme